MTEKKLVFSQNRIASRVKELGTAITEDYGKCSLLIVGVLNGAFMFMADLVREVKCEAEIDFVRLASYGMGTTAGSLRFTKDIEIEPRGKDILIVEDIVDTGHTLKNLADYFGKLDPNSVRFCVLIDKKERREIDVAVDYVGFEVQSGFLVGYGLDCSEQFRQLPEIYVLS